MNFSSLYSFFDDMIPKKTLIHQPSGNSPREMAIVVHIYYIDVFYRDILPKISQLEYRCDIFISTRNRYVEKVFSALHQLKSDSLIIVKGVENTGFDMYPFTSIFATYYSDYKYICKIHTKKSEYDKNLEKWGEYLIQHMLGNNDIVYGILDIFIRNPGIGIIFPDTYPDVIPMLKWGSNYNQTLALLKRVGLNASIDKQDLIFPAGSMFWFRPDSLLPLFVSSIMKKEYVSNFLHPRDGTLAHAIERSILYIAQQRGYDFYVLPGHIDEKNL
jgi:lipopolysaccharide biosynthesis protein